MKDGGESVPDAKEKRSFVEKTWGSIRAAIVGSGMVVMFGVAILVISFLAVTNPSAISPHEEATGVEKVKVEYYLPYPGLLPDSPLYKFKMMRDRIRLWLTRDEVKLAGLELMYADKRINAAIALADGGKVDLAVGTATKAQKYLERSVNRIIKLTGKGKDVKSMLMVLVKATAKHEELLWELQAKAVNGKREAVDQMVKLARQLEERVGQAIVDSF